MILVLACSIACGTHLSALDQQRAINAVDLFASLRKDVPDSGPAQLKTQAGYCNGRALLRSAGVAVPDAGEVTCPKN